MSTIWDYVASQFGKPRGLVGRLAGWIMAHRASNVARNEWTVALLDLAPDARVLEIGYGPGLALERVLDAVPDGHVVGVDHSRTMFEQAGERNRAAVAEGRLELLVGTVEEHADDLGHFDAVCSANVAMFWEDPVATYRVIRRLLGAGGQVATTYMPRHRGARPGDAYEGAEVIERQLRDAGFAETRIATLPLQPIPAVCVIGRRP